jgi:hypothetical protein
MAKAFASYNANPLEIQEISLDSADRRTIVLAGCLCLFRMKRTAEIGDWRSACADMDLPELMHAAAALGVRYTSGGHQFALPLQITPEHHGGGL